MERKVLGSVLPFAPKNIIGLPIRLPTLYIFKVRLKTHFHSLAFILE